MYKGLLLLCVLFITSGCGGGAEGNGTERVENEYAGVWTSDDNYLKITNEGDVVIYKCSFYDGYIPDNSETGTVVGNEMVLINDLETYSVQLEKQTENIVLTRDNEKIILKPAELPSICDEDGIELTFSSPQKAVEGELTTFTVDFDYRLSSSASAIIKVGFTSNDDGDFAFNYYNPKLEITERGFGSGTLSVESRPLFFENGTPYSLYLILYDNTDGAETFIPFSSAKVVIDVSEGLAPPTRKVGFEDQSIKLNKWPL